MASDRQIAANRRNAMKSTGPRTAGGKARAAGNSKKHGLAEDLSDDSVFGAADQLAKSIRQTDSGLSNAAAMTVAMAMLDLVRIRKARAVAIENTMTSNDRVSSRNQVAELLSQLKAIDRYEVRARSRTKRILCERGGSRIGRTNPIFSNRIKRASMFQLGGKNC